MYICIELFDEMQSAAVQRSYIVAKSLPTIFFLTTQRCHSDRYAKVSYPRQRYELFVSGCREPLVIFRLLNGFNDWQYIYIGCLNGSI